MPRWLLVTFMAAIAVLAVVVGAWFMVPQAQQPASQTQASVPIGGPFSLVDQNGRRVSEQDFRGRYALVYFGYTYCPDVCPLGLQTIAQALDELPPELQSRVVPLFITIDPERDTVPVIRDYVAAVDPRLVGLTGTSAEIAEATRAWRVYVRKGEAKDGAYLVDHSTFTYLMGPDGAYVTHFGHAATPEEMANRLKEALQAS